MNAKYPCGLIDRLEIRRMSIPGYRATWCDVCFRCLLHDPANKKEFVLMNEGDDDCGRTICVGTISECIASIREAVNE